MSDEGLVRPAHGVRLIVKLCPGSHAGGEYALALATPDADWQGAASVGDDGTVRFGAWPLAEPPDWVVQAARSLLRAAWQRRRAGHPWPRRLARWRPAPGAGDDEGGENA